MKKEIKQGFSIHCHHNILVGYCYNYKKRVAHIKSDKPENEQKTRLRLFKILPPEALKDIPKEYQEADKKWREAYKKREEEEKKRREAYKELAEAYKKLSEKDKRAFHKKWCGCKEYDFKSGELKFI